MGRQEEALVVAERGRTRAFVDLLLERQSTNNQGGINTLNNRMQTRQAFNAMSVESASATSLDHIIEVVNKQKACVLYFSIAAGYLYSWLLMPNKGLICYS